MDQNFILLLGAANLPPGETNTLRAKLRIKEDGSGDIEVVTADGVRPYTLKPLADLYGAGTGAASVDPTDERFMPLMKAIEEEIVRFDDAQPRFTDGGVSVALASLAMSPESSQTDPLAGRVQAALRLALSLNDYSRQEVRQAMRHVTRSVARHTRLAGPRGYLDFISRFFGSQE